MKACIQCGSKSDIHFRMAGSKRRYVCKCGNKGPLAHSPSTARIKWNFANTEEKPKPLKLEVLNEPVKHPPYKYIIAAVIIVAVTVFALGSV